MSAATFAGLILFLICVFWIGLVGLAGIAAYFEPEYDEIDDLDDPRDPRFVAYPHDDWEVPRDR